MPCIAGITQNTNIVKMAKYVAIGIAFIVALLIVGLIFSVNDRSEAGDSSSLFLKINNAEWKETFFDPGTKDWKLNWHLDGLKATVNNNSKGMDFKAGPTYRDDSCHAVLWTKKIFEGDIKIEYEYTKLDTFTRAVTIIYLLATGCQEGPFEKDIFRWNHLRVKPSMRTYFNNMNTYHISYAAFPMNSQGPDDDYIRARRYMPLAKNGLDGTALEPDYFKTGLFKNGIHYKITIIRKANDLFMNVNGDGKDMLCYWKTDSHPPIIEGRIGLRHMFTRAARYRDFRVSVLSSKGK